MKTCAHVAVTHACTTHTQKILASHLRAIELQLTPNGSFVNNSQQSLCTRFKKNVLKFRRGIIYDGLAIIIFTNPGPPITG